MENGGNMRLDIGYQFLIGVYLFKAFTFYFIENGESLNVFTQGKDTIRNKLKTNKSSWRMN